MPLKVQQGTDPLGYLGRGERDWRLMRVVAFDGLQPTKIRRFYEAPQGVDFAEATALPFRLDATPNADDRANAANVTTDSRRYVANPFGLKHQFAGLWTGGPCEWGRDQQTQKPQVEQDLTRTFCAGHGYTLDAEGRYVYSTATDSLEYMTAADCLKAHRPSLTSRFSPYMALREDIPGAYWREIVWRDFTHESIPFIEALKDDPATVREIAAHHFGARVAGDVQDLTTNVDPATNTVYAKCSLLLRDLAEPAQEEPTPEQAAAWLLSLPVIEAPCTRETLRIFGLNQFADGEGYRFTHTYRWPGLKDSPATRKALEFVCDRLVLPGLRAADYAADAPQLLESADGTGRFYTVQTQTPGDPTAVPPVPATTCRVPWWRIALQKLDEDKGEDGALAFTLVLVRPEWHGTADPSREVVSSVSNPLGWGVTENRVYPSLPRDAAAAAMSGVTSPDRRVVSGLSQSEATPGYSDVSFSLRRLFAYHGGTQDDPVPAADRLPAGTRTVEGFTYPTVDFATSATDANRAEATVTLPRVADGDLTAAIAAAKQAFADNHLTARRVRAVLDGDRSYTVTVSTNGYQKKGSGAAGETFTEVGTVTWKEIEKSYRRPDGAGMTPADGYWWRVVTYTAEEGRTSGGPADAKDRIVGGGPGSKIWPERSSSIDRIGSVWCWRKVTAIAPGAWSAGSVVWPPQPDPGEGGAQ